MFASDILWLSNIQLERNNNKTYNWGRFVRILKYQGTFMSKPWWMIKVFGFRTPLHQLGNVKPTALIRNPNVSSNLRYWILSQGVSLWSRISTSVEETPITARPQIFFSNTPTSLQQQPSSRPLRLHRSPLGQIRCDPVFPKEPIPQIAYAKTPLATATELVKHLTRKWFRNIPEPWIPKFEPSFAL